MSPAEFDNDLDRARAFVASCLDSQVNEAWENIRRLLPRRARNKAKRERYQLMLADQIDSGWRER